MNSGIYQIRCLFNQNKYIGSSCRLLRRQSEHFSRLRNNAHYNKYLQRAFNKYGEDNFVFEILEYCDKSVLLIREQHYLDILQPEYNNYFSAKSPLGIKWTDQTKLKMSIAHTGKKLSDATKKILSEQKSGDKHPNWGKHLSEKTKKKISEAKTNKPPQ